MATVTKSVVLKSYVPEGVPGPEHFDIVESPAPVKCSGDGKIILEVKAMSADPYLRGQIKEGKGMKPGMTMRGFIAGKVIQSTHDDWAVGDLAGANLPFSSVQEVDVAKATMLWKLQGLTEDHLSVAIGALGMPGATAYGGFVGVLRPKEEPKEKEVVWVSAAGGAVGSLVGQIAKNVYGCTVIGTAGGPEKCKLVTEKFKFDHCIDYREAKGDAKKLEEMIRAVAPDGIDMYFENVGGIHFEAAARLLRPHGRIAVCGGISAYNEKGIVEEKLDIRNMIYNFHRIEGFVCNPWLTGQKGEFHKVMPEWISEGKIVVEETVFEGVEKWPLAFQSLFTGGNNGKVVVKV